MRFRLSKLETVGVKIKLKTKQDKTKNGYERGRSHQQKWQLKLFILYKIFMFIRFCFYLIWKTETKSERETERDGEKRMLNELKHGD